MCVCNDEGLYPFVCGELPRFVDANLEGAENSLRAGCDHLLPRLVVGFHVLLARNPKSALYADLPDFTFRRMEVEGGHLNGGFAKAGRLGPAELLTDVSGAEALAEAEEDAIAHMNADHAEALALYATRLCGAPDGKWAATGCDPEGVDLAAGDLTARLTFSGRITDTGALRRTLVALAAEARARG